MAGQNTSSAVMAQRTEAHDSLDDFPTMPWGTRALVEHVLFPAGVPFAMMKVWEPAANRGYMVSPLEEYFATVYASDVHDYGAGFHVHDFLQPYRPDGFDDIEFVITNPPFRLAKQFIERGLDVASVGIAVVVRTSFLEGIDRYETLFRDNPPTIVAPFVERIPMFRGRIDPTGSSATSYTWLVWIKDCEPMPMCWIPPCRRGLERPGDYKFNPNNQSGPDRLPAVNTEAAGPAFRLGCSGLPKQGAK